MLYRLTHENGEFNEAAIAARAAELLGKTIRVQIVQTGKFSLWEEHRITPEQALASARREADTERSTRLFEIEQRRQQAAFEADCQALAANYRYDVAALQFERDYYFFGNSTSRPVQLPRYKRALAIALEREAARSKAA